MKLSLSSRGGVIRACIALAVLYWVADSAVNSLILGERGLTQQLFAPTYQELRTKLIVVSILLSFGFFSQYIVAEIKQAQNQIRKLSRAVEQSPAMVVITDTEGIIEYVNPKFTEVTGYEPKDVLGRNPGFLKSGETPSREYELLWQALASGKEWRGEFHNRKSDGTLYWESASISPIRDVDGNVTYYVAIKEDITQRKYAEQELLRAATHDALTGLFNRHHFMESLELAAHAAKRYSYPVSLCLCDLDNFKAINDTHGHRAGDEVLAAFGKIIRDQFRAEDFAGRYGGDEFCIVFPHVSSGEAGVCVERIRGLLHERVFGKRNDGTFRATASFGIAELSPETDGAKALLDTADQALYDAKGAGRNRTVARRTA